MEIFEGPSVAYPVGSTVYPGYEAPGSFVSGEGVPVPVVGTNTPAGPAGPTFQSTLADAWKKVTDSALTVAQGALTNLLTAKTAPKPSPKVSAILAGRPSPILMYAAGAALLYGVYVMTAPRGRYSRRRR